MAKSEPRINVLVVVDSSGGMTFVPPTGVQKQVRAWLSSLGLPPGSGAAYFDPDEMEYRLEDRGEVARLYMKAWKEGRAIKHRGAPAGKELEVRMGAQDFAAHIDADFVRVLDLDDL